MGVDMGALACDERLWAQSASIISHSHAEKQDAWVNRMVPCKLCEGDSWRQAYRHQTAANI